MVDMNVMSADRSLDSSQYSSFKYWLLLETIVLIFFHGNIEWELQTPNSLTLHRWSLIDSKWESRVCIYFNILIENEIESSLKPIVIVMNKHWELIPLIFVAFLNSLSDVFKHLSTVFILFCLRKSIPFANL